MTEADVIQPSASVASTGKGIRYIGDHCYALSGEVTDAASGSADTTCLDFTTGSGYIVAEIAYSSNSASGAQDEYIDISYNNQSIWKPRYTSSAEETNDQPFKILIPPRTRFIFKWGITADTRQMSVILTGRVYGEK